MLRKTALTPTFVRSLRAGSLLLAASLGMTLAAQAGEADSRTASSKDSKDKNVIQQPPPAAPKFYVEVLGGAEFDIHATKFISNGSTVFTGAGGGALAAPKIQSRDFSSTHDPVTNARLNLGYKILPYLSLFTGFTYSHANGHERRVGSVTDFDGAVLGNVGARYDLYASLGDYQAYSGRGGFKLTLPRTILDFIHAPKALTPYLTASAGGKYIESQELRFYSGTRPTIVDTGYGTLYGNSWVFTTEAEFGYELKLTRNASVVLESGYGYDTKPKGGSLPGVNGVDRGGDRLYSTVSLGAKIKF